MSRAVRRDELRNLPLRIQPGGRVFRSEMLITVGSLVSLCLNFVVIELSGTFTCKANYFRTIARCTAAYRSLRPSLRRALQRATSMFRPGGVEARPSLAGATKTRPTLPFGHGGERLLRIAAWICAKPTFNLLSILRR